MGWLLKRENIREGVDSKVIPVRDRTAYRALESSSQPRAPGALSPVSSGGWVGFRSDCLAFVKRGWLDKINMTVRNFAHPSATDTGCTRPHLRKEPPPPKKKRRHYHFYSS